LGEVTDIIDHPLKHKCLDIGATPGEVLHNVKGKVIVALTVELFDVKVIDRVVASGKLTVAHMKRCCDK